MPNPADYNSILVQRRQEVRSELERLLPTHPDFVWEVGCGHGHFLTAFATAHPAKLCIGIDVASERIERAVRKKKRARLTNLHFIRSEARLFLQALPAGAKISELFLLFPDPWPKSRHHKHRVIQADFLAAVHPFASPECRLCFRTDHRPYFEDVQTIIGCSADWQLRKGPWPFEFQTVFQSRAQSYDSLIAGVRRMSP